MEFQNRPEPYCLECHHPASAHKLNHFRCIESVGYKRGKEKFCKCPTTWQEIMEDYYAKPLPYPEAPSSTKLGTICSLPSKLRAWLLYFRWTGKFTRPNSRQNSVVDGKDR